MPEVGSQNTTSAGYFHFLFGNLNPGGNESMTKQRIGVLVVSALLAVASLAQAPPAKQKPAAKKSGGAVSGGPVMPEPSSPPRVTRSQPAHQFAVSSWIHYL